MTGRDGLKKLTQLNNIQNYDLRSTESQKRVDSTKNAQKPPIYGK